MELPDGKGTAPMASPPPPVSSSPFDGWVREYSVNWKGWTYRAVGPRKQEACKGLPTLREARPGIRRPGALPFSDTFFLLFLSSSLSSPVYPSILLLNFDTPSSNSNQSQWLPRSLSSTYVVTPPSSPRHPHHHELHHRQCRRCIAACHL